LASRHCGRMGDRPRRVRQQGRPPRARRARSVEGTRGLASPLSSTQEPVGAGGVGERWPGSVRSVSRRMVSSNTVTALAVLAGLINVVGTDRLGQMGHAFLWDPLFTLWGIALAAGLVLSHSSSR